MKRKLISISAVVLALVLLLTLAPACGNGGGEVKTLKIGFSAQLSGPAAPWGVVFLKGTEWARDVINDQGGLDVGGDTYMIEVVSCDDKGVGSESATCLNRLIHDEGIDYIIGPHLTGPCEAAFPIGEQFKTFTSCISFQRPDPALQYNLACSAYPPDWVGGFYSMLREFNPEVKTVAYIHPVTDDTPTGFAGSTRNLGPEYGFEVLGSASFTTGTVDFYPQLTKLINLNPDVIGTPACAPTDNGLITKQLRELGFEGLIWHVTGGPVPALIEVAGAEAMEGVITNEVDYKDPVVPAASRAIAEDFNRRYPGEIIEFVTAMGYVNTMFYFQAIEEAESIDPEEVLKVVNQVGWKFDRFGVEGALGGIETFGINRQMPILFVYSVVENSKVMVKGVKMVETP